MTYFKFDENGKKFSKKKGVENILGQEENARFE